jgi:prepilin-type N-terminal cleavage/methylation domain-containing protein
VNRRGFTLVELLTVVAIIALVSGMILGTRSTGLKEAQVKVAADQFAAFVCQVRARAVADNQPYGIAINIQNAPGSSGRVINNRSGGHWYRMVRPPRHTWGQGSSGNRLLIAWPDTSEIRLGGIATFPHFIEALKETWAGPQHTLPAGKVRFLALGDTDEGPRVNGSDQGGGYYQDRSYGYPSTYPRPYFGYFDPARKRLFPWGGYDPALSAAEPLNRLTGGGPTIDNYTGFFYQGADPIIPDSRNPVDRTFNVDWNNDGDFADTDPVRGPETGYRVFQQGEPRPLVSGDWQDFLIIFSPEGNVSVPPFKTNRKRFSRLQYDFVNDAKVNFCNGVLDTTKPWFGGGGMNPGIWEYNFNFVASNGFTEAAEVAHFDRHTGSYRITFAPDSLDDRDAFADSREALASMWPLWRVEISKQGDVRSYQTKRADDGWLDGKTVFPAAKSVWTQVSAADRKTVGERCKWGWLQQGKTVSGATWAFFNREIDAVPAGTPITNVITPRMMTEKVWWFE